MSRGVLVVGVVAMMASWAVMIAESRVWAGGASSTPATAATPAAPAAASATATTPTATTPAAATNTSGDASATTGSATAVDYAKIPPADLVKNTPQGKLVNPYKDTQADIVEAGQQGLLHYSCSGCHGGGGGGGMCPPLTNDTWVYGGDDDTLFRLVTLGSDEMQKGGYTRKGRENVVGPMPPFAAIIPNSDDLWKIITFIRSKYNGDPGYKFGTPPAPAQ